MGEEDRADKASDQAAELWATARALGVVEEAGAEALPDSEATLVAEDLAASAAAAVEAEEAKRHWSAAVSLHTPGYAVRQLHSGHFAPEDW